jgi:hypothetical protein
VHSAKPIRHRGAAGGASPANPPLRSEQASRILKGTHPRRASELQGKRKRIMRMPTGGFGLASAPAVFPAVVDEPPAFTLLLPEQGIDFQALLNLAVDAEYEYVAQQVRSAFDEPSFVLTRDVR